MCVPNNNVKDPFYRSLVATGGALPKIHSMPHE
jgi:hypothetical protein